MIFRFKRSREVKTDCDQRKRSAPVEFRGIAGQNTAEYLIMLVLVAVGTIGMISMFGASIKGQFRNAIASLEGYDEKVVDGVVTDKSEDLAKKGTGMKIEANDVKRFEGE